MAVRVQVPPSAPYQKGAVTLNCCSIVSFLLPRPVKTVISVLLLHVFLSFKSFVSTPNTEISIGYDEQTEENRCDSHF